MGNLFIKEYNEKFEEEIFHAVCIINPLDRIKVLELIEVPDKSRYRTMIDDLIIDTKLKTIW